MAKMAFREKNMVRWVGTRPGHNGTAVYASDEANNGIVTIYTVPANNTLFITSSLLSVHATIKAQVGQMLIHTGGAVLYKMHTHRSVIDHTLISNFAYHFPLEVAATYEVRVYAINAQVWSNGLFYGFLVPNTELG